MGDMISRQDAIDGVKKIPDLSIYAYCSFVDMLIHLPSAEPEIIRCKDCKHRYIEDMTWHCPFGLMGGENFFCGYGSLGIVERRTDE